VPVVVGGWRAFGDDDGGAKRRQDREMQMAGFASGSGSHAAAEGAGAIHPKKESGCGRKSARRMTM
jgi:hypothetical protein